MSTLHAFCFTVFCLLTSIAPSNVIRTPSLSKWSIRKDYVIDNQRYSTYRGNNSAKLFIFISCNISLDSHLQREHDCGTCVLRLKFLGVFCRLPLSVRLNSRCILLTFFLHLMVFDCPRNIFFDFFLS